MEIRKLQLFAKELKKLRKRYRTLDNDVEKLLKVLRVVPQGDGSKHWNLLYISECRTVSIYKVRLSCAAMKGESRFRIIYAYNKKEDSLECIDLIELYFKGDKESESKERIDEYLKNFS